MPTDPVNNIAAKITEHDMTPEQTGYVAVSMAMQEAAVQLCMVAEQGLTPAQILVCADRLADLAKDTALLGQAQTGGGR